MFQHLRIVVVAVASLCFGQDCFKQLALGYYKTQFANLDAFLIVFICIRFAFWPAANFSSIRCCQFCELAIIKSKHARRIEPFHHYSRYVQHTYDCHDVIQLLVVVYP